MDFSYLFTLTGAFFIGYAIAYAIKMSFKMMIIALGFLFMAAFFLQTQGALTIDPKGLNSFVENILKSMHNALLYFDNVVSNYPSEGLGAGAGFLYGLKKR